MCPSSFYRALFLCVVFALIKGSYQQELFEDAVELENADPIFESNLYSNAEENDIPGPGGTSITGNMPFEPPYGDPAASENGRENQQTSEDEEPEVYSPNIKDIDEDSKTNMEQDYEHFDVRKMKPAPHADTMASINELAEYDSGKMPERQKLYTGEDFVKDERLRMKDQHEHKENNNMAGEDSTNNANGKHNEGKSKQKDKKHHKGHVPEKDTMHVVKHETKNEKVATKDKSYQDKSLEQNTEVEPKHKHKDNDDSLKPENAQVEHKLKQHKESKDISKTEDFEQKEKVKSNDNKTMNAQSLATDSSDNEQLRSESTFKESTSSSNDNSQETSSQKLSPEELPSEMPSAEKLRKINDKAHAANATNTEDEKVNALSKDLKNIEKKEAENELYDKETEETHLESVIEQPAAPQEVPGNDVQDKEEEQHSEQDKEQPVLTQEIPGNNVDQNQQKQHLSPHEVPLSEEQDSKSNEKHLEPEKEQPVAPQEIPGNDFDQGSSSNFESHSHIKENAFPDENKAHSKDYSENESKGTSTKKDSDIHEESFEEIIKRERDQKKREQEKKTSEDVLSTLEDAEEQHPQRHSEPKKASDNVLSTLEDADEQHPQRHSGHKKASDNVLSTLEDADEQHPQRHSEPKKASDNVLSTLEDADEQHPRRHSGHKKASEDVLSTLEDADEQHPRRHKKHTNILSTLPDARPPKHHNENDLNQIVEKDYEQAANASFEHYKHHKRQRNILETLPNVKPPRKNHEDQNEDIHEIFAGNQNLDNITLEGTNGTAYSVDVMGKINKGHIDDLSGIKNKSLPSAVDLNKEKSHSEQKSDKNGDAAKDLENSSEEQAASDEETISIKEETQETEHSGNDDDSGSAVPSASIDTDNVGGETVHGDVTKGEPVVVVPSNDDGSSSEIADTAIEDGGESGSGQNPAGEDGKASDGNDEETSGADRERRQAFTTEEEINKAKAKLKSAQGASDVLTSIEKEMGLDPAIAPTKTKNLTSALHTEINKFKDIISHQDDAVKQSKFQKLEKLAEEDVKGANDVMKLIVELEVAKFFAKHRARKKLELAMRNKIASPPAQAPPAPEWNPYQGVMPYYMQPYQDQGYSPYAPYPPPAPFAPLPSLPQAPPPSNPLAGQFMDNNVPPPPPPPPMSFFAPAQNEPQDYSPYVGTPMNNAPGNMYQQHLSAYIPPVGHPSQSNGPNLVANEATMPPQQKPKELEDELPKQKMENTLPKSSPFAGLRPLSLSSLKPIHAVPQASSFGSEMKGQSAPFSSLTQNSLEASSLHPFSDYVSNPPPVKPNVQQFYPQSPFAPPPRVNTFSDSLSHLHLDYQKPAASFRPETPKPAAPVKPQPPKLSSLVGSRAKPLTTHQFHPEPQFVPPMQQQYYDVNPAGPHAPPMYPQFQMPAPLEPAVPVQQFNPYFPAAPQPPQMPYMAAPAYPQPQQPQKPFTAEQKPDEKQYDENPMNQKFNDEQVQQPQNLPYQGPQVYPQQQTFNGYNSWPNPGMQYAGDSYSWPQSPYSQGYGYQPYEQQLVNPLLNDAITKIHDTSKAAQVVQKIENKIGLSPPAVSHIIDDVESETKNEKTQFDQQVKQEEEKIKNDKKLSDEVPDNENLKNKINEEQHRLDDDIKRENIAKTKLETIKKIEKILTVIETAKYSALKRAKEHLLRLKSEKDPQIRKRSLEALERDLHNSEEKHLHRRNEINIWLKGSRNNINTSHFLEGKKKGKHEEKKRSKLDVFGSPSIPKLEIANFAAKFAKKANITLPKVASKKTEIKKPKKEKVGVILMRKLLTRMDDLYDMQSKILTQLIKDHQKAQDEKQRMRKRRSLKRHPLLRHVLRHNRHHNRHSKS